MMPATRDQLASDTVGSPRFVFVGERRSPRAIQMDVRWVDGRLAAKNLYAALQRVGIDPHGQIYRNLYHDADPRTIDQEALAEVPALAVAGTTIIGMGRTVQRALEQAGLPHRRLVHPAARGAIRARATYQAHVASILTNDRLEPSS